MTKEEIQISNKHIKRFSDSLIGKCKWKYNEISIFTNHIGKTITLRLDSSWVLFQMKPWHVLYRPVRPQDHFALLSAKTVLVYPRMTSKFLTQKLSIQQWLDSWVQPFLLFIIYTLSSQFLQSDYVNLQIWIILSINS